jgi:HTH-type transcriptional regulator/antitoxin HipB
MNTIARNAKQFGASIRRARRQQGLTQRALSDLMNVRQATVSKLEAGEPGTQIGIFIDALAALGLELVVRPRSKTSTEDIADLF